MNPASLSDEALGRLLFESKTTVRKLDIPTSDVFHRVQRFSRLYGQLPTKLEGAALLYESLGAVCCHQLGERTCVGRLSKNEQHPDGCDLALPDEELSRRHFEIVRVDNLYLLRDLGSRNGTRVNHNPEKVGETVLKAGDVIQAGRSLFVFTGE